MAIYFWQIKLARKAEQYPVFQNRFEFFSSRLQGRLIRENSLETGD